MENHNLKNLTKNSFTIYVRHGESEQNQIIHKSEGQQVQDLQKMYDPELTDLGKKQAEMTAEYLCYMLDKYYPHVTINVWVSPFKRTKQTAQPFIDKKPQVVVNSQCLNHLLQEYTSEKNKYPIEMVESMDIIPYHKDLYHYYDCIKALSERIKIFNRNDDVNPTVLIIFGHSLTFSQLLTYQSNNEAYQPQEISRIHLPNCSISVVQYQQSETKFRGWQIYQTGNIAHLAKYATGIHTPFGMSDRFLLIHTLPLLKWSIWVALFFIIFSFILKYFLKI